MHGTVNVKKVIPYHIHRPVRYILRDNPVKFLTFWHAYQYKQ